MWCGCAAAGAPVFVNRLVIRWEVLNRLWIWMQVIIVICVIASMVIALIKL
jgi:hypothetical protein